MFWIKDRDGGAVNLARATNFGGFPPDKYTSINDLWEVRAEFGSHQTVLFSGTAAQCGHFRDELLRALKERENADLD